MSLLETIHTNFTAAMKERRDAELSTLRMLRAALKNKQIELGRDLTDADALAVVKTQIKQVKDSEDAFRSGGRRDLADRASAEGKTLARYLPVQLSDQELEGVVDEALRPLRLSKADTGRAMGCAIAAVDGRADGSRVKAAVEKILTAFVPFAVWLLSAPVTLAAAKKAKPETRDWLGGEGVEVAYRLARAVAVLCVILFVCHMFVGAFQQIVSSGKDDDVVAGRRKIALGFLGSVFMIGLYVAATNALRHVT
jgi:uncharacterized protein YqeY